MDGLAASIGYLHGSNQERRNHTAVKVVQRPRRQAVHAVHQVGQILAPGNHTVVFHVGSEQVSRLRADIDLMSDSHFQLQ